MRQIRVIFYILLITIPLCGLVLLIVLLICDGIKPSRLPMRDSHMKQITAFICAMPVHSPGRCPHNISDIQSLGLAALVAHPAASGSDFEDLAVFVVVPVGPCAGREHDVVDGDALCLVGEDGIGPDVAGEGRPSKFGLLARGTGVADNCHRHAGGVFVADNWLRRTAGDSKGSAAGSRTWKVVREAVQRSIAGIFMCAGGYFVGEGSSLGQCGPAACNCRPPMMFADCPGSPSGAHRAEYISLRLSPGRPDHRNSTQSPE